MKLAETERPFAVLRVATYNIRKCIGLDWRRRSDRVIAVLQELRADVVAVQEADRRFGDRSPTLPQAALEQHAGLTAVPTGRPSPSSGHHGNAILVSKHATILDATTLDLPSLEPRGALIADIALRGEKVTIVAVHLGLRASDRMRQVKMILSEVTTTRDPRRTIILGDMNAWSITSPAMAALAADFQPSRTLKSFHSAIPVAPLDRIFLGHDFRFGETFVHRSTKADVASDHLPVCADVTIDARARTGDGPASLEEASTSIS